MVGTEKASMRGTGSRGDWQEGRPEELEPEGLSVHPEAISVSGNQTPDPQVLIVRIQLTYHMYDVQAAQWERDTVKGAKMEAESVESYMPASGGRVRERERED